jgi:CarD family transcriptional regulator
VFEKGEYVVYGNLGVCKVQDLVTRRFEGLEAEHLYYVLEPVYQGGVLYVPADNPKIYIRRVISADEANRLIDTLPETRGEAFHSHSAQELSAHYAQAMQTHKCEDLMELTKSIYHKKETMARQGKKFGRVDEHYMRQAEDTLFGELAVALGIPRDGVQGYISQRLGAARPERA